MKRIILILCLLVSSSLSYELKAVNDAVNELLNTVSGLYQEGNYEDCSLFVFNYFIEKNSGEKKTFGLNVLSRRKNDFYEDDGTLSYSLAEFIPSAHDSFGGFHVPFYYEEALVYYFGALSFLSLSERANINEASTNPIIHFKSHNNYSLNAIRLSYHFIAYILADLALPYLEDVANTQDYLWIDRGINRTKQQYFSLLQMRHECMQIKSLFDYRYYKVSDVFYYTLGRNMNIWQYLKLAQNPRKSVKQVQIANKDVLNYGTKNKNDVFNNKIEYLDFELNAKKPNCKEILKDYLPVIEDTLWALFENSEKDVNEEKEKLYIIKKDLDTIFNCIYNISEKEKIYSSFVSACVNAYIAYDIVLYSMCNQFDNNLRPTWSIIRSLLTDHDFIVFPFATTNGTDNWLQGFVLSGENDKPFLRNFGHTYDLEHDVDIALGQDAVDGKHICFITSFYKADLYPVSTIHFVEKKESVADIFR